MPLRTLIVCLALLAGLALPVFAAPRKIAQLEQQLEDIDRQLGELAAFSMQTSVGAIGFRSIAHPEPDHSEWIQIDFNSEHELDLIVLVPAIWRDTGKGFIADGFPLEFEIIAGSPAQPDGQTIARFTGDEQILPRIAPLAIPCPGTTATWVRLVATRLSPRAWDGAHVLQLSEIMLFAGEENLALHQTVSASSNLPNLNFGARSLAYLVDGSVPYLMNSGRGKRSQAYVANLDEDLEGPGTFTIDLGETHPVNRLHLHSIEVADTAPQANRADFGLPRRLTLSGANQADFSDATVLCTVECESIYDAAPIIARRFMETPCRFLRLTVEDPDTLHPYESTDPSDFFGFAEVEVFSRGKNILRDRVLTPNPAITSPDRVIEDLTDGRNIFGTILTTRDWMEQLALRHELQTARPVVAAELNRLYTQQQEQFDLLKILTILLGCGILILVLISRMRRMRAISGLRHRFAADLHDEIGANLHAIGLLSDIAREQSTALPDNEALTDTVTEVRAVTGRTADAVRYLADSQNPRKPIGTLEEDMRRIAARVMDETTWDIAVSGEEHIARLPPRTRADLFLFYKECLVNISRHSGATHFSGTVVATVESVRMTIEDNGCGLDHRNPPPSLVRRAGILRAKLNFQSPPPDAPQGTRIDLRIRKGLLTRFLP